MPNYDDEEYLDDLEDAAENVVIAYNMGTPLHGSLKVLANNIDMELREEDDEKPIESLHETLGQLLKISNKRYDILKAAADSLSNAASALIKNFEKKNVENLQKALFDYDWAKAECDSSFEKIEVKDDPSN